MRMAIDLPGTTYSCIRTKLVNLVKPYDTVVVQRVHQTRLPMSKAGYNLNPQGKYPFMHATAKLTPKLRGIKQNLPVLIHLDLPLISAVSSSANVKQVHAHQLTTY